MASFAPIAGRLCLIFSLSTCMFTACIALAIGAAITAAASGFASFVLGRAISGFGAAGITTVSINMVLQLSSAKRRGLFLGLVNSGFTLGVLLGSAASGALLPRIGWVRSTALRSAVEASNISISERFSGSSPPWHY
jgi:MFS family permease